MASTHEGNETAAQLESLLSPSLVMKSLNIWGALPWAAPSVKTLGLDTHFLSYKWQPDLEAQKAPWCPNEQIPKTSIAPLAVLQSSSTVEFIWIVAIPICSPILIAHSCVARTNRMREEHTPCAHIHMP